MSTQLNKTGRSKSFDFKDLKNHKGQISTTPEVKPIEFDGPVNHWYSTVRNGVVKRTYLIEVKKDEVRLKDHPDDKHSHSLSLAKFVKFYKVE